MKSEIHFISGLPRSGSTLLAAILRQNPQFVAGMTSPVASIFRSVEDSTARKVETSVFISDDQRERLLKGIFLNYYEDFGNKIVFDTSRMWCARLPLLTKLFSQSKVICCVREIGWVMDSFERIYRRNDQKPSGIYGFDTCGTVYSRTISIAQSSGVVGYALDALREAYASEQSDRLLLIDYESLCKDPQVEVNRIYDFIGQEKFDHNFKQVEYSAGEFDRQLGAPGLHDVKGEVEWRPRETILPITLFERFNEDNFWRVKCPG